MELLVNDLSIHGQFPNLQSFKLSFGRIMAIREVALRYGRKLHCHRNVAYAQVTREHTMQQAVQSFSSDQQRAIMGWLTKHGPFWEDLRSHTPNDYLMCGEELVTDTAVGESAHCCYHGLNRHLVSLSPSNWNISPIQVIWFSDDDTEIKIEVFNYWDRSKFETVLSSVPIEIDSWIQLKEQVTSLFPELVISNDAFASLASHPFSYSVSQQIIARLKVLNRLKSCFDADGKRTQEGHKLYKDYFTGDRAWFSDSSSTEKRDFEKELTFPNPIQKEQTLFCPFHGKISRFTIRIHFSSPISKDEPLYVVYIGPKITKR